MSDSPSASPASVRRQLIAALRNQLLGHGSQLLSRVLLTPYVLSRLSHEEYGLWAWMQTVTSLFILAELGFTLGTVHPLAHAVRDRDIEKVGRILAGALSVPVAVISAIVAAVVLFRPSVGSVLGGTPGDDAVAVFVILTITQGIVLCGFPLLSLLAGMQRLDVVHGIRTPQVVGQALLTVVLLECGGRVLSLAWLNLAAAAFHTLVRLWFCARLLPGLRLVRPRREDFVQLRSLGGPQMLLNLLGAAAFSFERAFLGFTTDLAAFAQYAVASRLVTVVWEVQQVPFQSVLQSSAALDAASDRAGLSRLYARSLRLVTVVVFGLVATVIVCGPALVRAWLGEGFAMAGYFCRPLAVAVLFPSICGPPTGILAGRARLGRMSRLVVGWAVVCVLADAAWLLATGMAGAGWALMVINVAGSLYFIHRFQRDEGEPPQWGTLVAIFAAAVPAAVAAWLLGADIEARLGSGRLQAFCSAAGAGLVLWLSYGVLLRSFGLIEAGDRKLLGDFFRLRGGKKTSMAGGSA